jgi:antitoxin component of RelBE/YafQ-DinJ toxin-antitoxin module
MASLMTRLFATQKRTCLIDTITNHHVSDMIELNELNSSAIHIYLKCVATEDVIPIELHIPKAKTIAHRAEITNQKNMPTL